MKTSNILIRVSDEEKEKAVKVASLLNKKNISTMFRDYINHIYDLNEQTKLCSTKSGFSIDDLIADLKCDLELKKMQKSISLMDKYSLQHDINMLINIKKKKGL